MLPVAKRGSKEAGLGGRQGEKFNLDMLNLKYISGLIPRRHFEEGI